MVTITSLLWSFIINRIISIEFLLIFIIITFIIFLLIFSDYHY